MKYIQIQTKDRFLQNYFFVLKLLMTLVLVFSLSSCADKAGGQDVSINKQKPAVEISKVSRKFSETSPPEIIQELRGGLENYQPQVTIITPKSDEVIEDNTVTIRFQVKDLPIFKDPQWQLGPHLHVIVDNQPYIAVYDLNQPLVFSDLSAGTHTLRVFASRPWHESFKNEGAYAQIKFHVFTKTDDNNPDSDLPVLTYSRPNGSYGAEPIMLDFYLTNAPLHIVAEDHPEDTMSDWRIRCTINGESFILDRWQTAYLKGFKPGKNWVKLEFLDNQGNPVKNVFNSTVRVINYQPNGKDTLSRIMRGEVTADEVRGIVDPNYTVEIPVTEPMPTVTPKVEETPAPQPKVEKPAVPEIEVSPTPQPKLEPKVETTPTPKIEVSPIPQLKIEPKTEKPAVPEIEVSPTPQPKLEPEVETTPTPKIEVSPIPQPTVEPKVEKPAVPEIEVSPTPQPKLEPKLEKPAVPEIEVSPTPQPTVEPKVEKPAVPEIEVSPTPQPQVEPQIETTPIPEVEVRKTPSDSSEQEKSQAEKTETTKKTGLSRLSDYFKYRNVVKPEENN